jgi:hypothetical protein
MLPTEAPQRQPTIPSRARSVEDHGRCTHPLTHNALLITLPRMLVAQHSLSTRLPILSSPLWIVVALLERPLRRVGSSTPARPAVKT